MLEPSYEQRDLTAGSPRRTSSDSTASSQEAFRDTCQNRVTNNGTSLLVAPGGHHRTAAVGQHSLLTAPQSEAYCDICQKELCNKYYLATHRRLKHSPPLTKGTLNTIMISQDSMPQNVDLNMLFNLGNGDHNKALQNLYMNTQAMGNGSPSPSSQPSSGAASTVGAGVNVENATENSAKTPPATGGELNMQNIFANIMQQQNVSQILEQMQAMNGMNMFNPLAALQGGGLLMGGSPNKMKPKEPMKSGGQNPMNFAFPFNLAPSTSTASQQSVIVSHNGDGEITPPQKRSKFESEGDENSKTVEHLINSLTSGSSICNECGKDCENPLALITHKAQEHEADKQAIISPTFSCNECDKQFKGPHFLEQHKMTAHNPTSRLLMGVPAGFPFGLPINLNQQFGIPDFDPASAMAQALSTPKGPANMKRQYSSNGKNYCDLCNKEVCNKYFLRTHMLKMHGIVIDENKTVIGNIDTLEKERQGALSFRCDICLTEMKTRQLLRQHKQEKHGVMPVASQPRIQTQKPSLPPGLAAMINPSMMLSAEEIKCPMCEKILSASQLPIHVQNDHRQEASQLFGGPVPSSPSFECKFCPHISKDADEHQGHQLSVHTAEFLQQQITKEAQKLDPSILRCNQCQYSTKDQKNLEMHVERHERMNEAKIALGQDLDEDEALQMTTEVALQMAVANKLGEQAFKCAVCNFSSADEQSLEAHTNMAHGLNLTVTKKEVETEKILERNSHTSGSLSPSSESLPEGFVKAAQDKNHVMQNFVLRISDPQGLFVGELIAQLPVKSLVANTSKLIVEAIPQ